MMATPGRLERIARLATVMTFLAGWELVAGIVQDGRLVPGIGTLLWKSLPSLGVFSDAGRPGFASALGVIGQHGLFTLGHVLVGLVVGIPLGVAGGLGVHLLGGAIAPGRLVLIVLRSIPLLSLIPLFSFWFGTSSLGIVAYIGFGTSAVVSSIVYDAARTTGRTFLHQAQLLGASRRFALRTVLLPSVMPALVGAFRVIAGLAWAFALGAEYIASTSGLGFLAYQSYLYSDMGKLGCLLFVYVGLGYSAYRITAGPLNHLVRWQPSTRMRLL